MCHYEIGVGHCRRGNGRESHESKKDIRLELQLGSLMLNEGIESRKLPVVIRCIRFHSTLYSRIHGTNLTQDALSYISKSSSSLILKHN